MSGGFVMVPDWLRAKKPSGNALLAYINLGSFGTFKPGSGTYDECRPSLGRLAEEMGVSESTAKRAITELLELGAAVRVRRFNRDNSPAPSVYRLVFGAVVPEQGVGSRADPPPSTHGPTLGSPVDDNQEPPTQNQPSRDSSSADASSSSTRVAPRQRKADDDDATQKPKRERKPKTDAQREAEAEARKQQQRATAIAEISRRIEVDADDAALLCDHFIGEGARVIDAYVDTCTDDELLDHLDTAQSARDDDSWDTQNTEQQRRAKVADDRRSADDLADQLRRYHHHAAGDQFAAVADAIFAAMQGGLTGGQASDRLNKVALDAARRKVADHYISAFDPWAAVAA